jgi:hypothetical protein
VEAAEAPEAASTMTVGIAAAALEAKAEGGRSIIVTSAEPRDAVTMTPAPPAPVAVAVAVVEDEEADELDVVAEELGTGAGAGVTRMSGARCSACMTCDTSRCDCDCRSTLRTPAGGSLFNRRPLTVRSPPVLREQKQNNLSGS